MHFLQFLFRANFAALLLVFCLQLGINKAQEDTQKAITMHMKMPQEARQGDEVSVNLTVQTELKECLVIQSYLVSQYPIEGPFTYKNTACLCKDNPKTFYWDFQVSETVAIAAVTHVIEEEGICPNNKAVVPFGPKYFYTTGRILVY
ncbi:prolactin-inducible protein [Crocuta crocuta]